MLGILQSFDPTGICARDFAECLALQLKERNRFDPAMQALILRLDLVAKRDFAALKKLCGVGDEDLAEMIAEVRRLNPKPGLGFGSTVVQPIVPDVFVRPGPDGWLDCGTKFRHLAEGSGQPELLRRGLGRGAARYRQKLSRRMPAKRDVAGARARSARPHYPQGRERNRAPAGRIFSRTASSICGRSILRRSPRPSACTNRPCRASPRINTWPPAAAYSSSNISSLPQSRRRMAAKRIRRRRCVTASSN